MSEELALEAYVTVMMGIVAFDILSQRDLHALFVDCDLMSFLLNSADFKKRLTRKLKLNFDKIAVLNIVSERWVRGSTFESTSAL